MISGFLVDGDCKSPSDWDPKGHKSRYILYNHSLSVSVIQSFMFTSILEI